MGKSLVITEKPSVASDIAKALGGFSSRKDFFESDRYIIGSAVGHLLELKVPDKEEVRKGKWTFAHLPVIPSKFSLAPIKANSGRLSLIKRLIKREDVDELINACDAGREGELIFRNIVRHARCSKPIRRLWLQSMTRSAIRTGFESLRDGQEFEPLADAAACRSESDWLVGINGTRAMTAFNSKSGGFYKTTVGRVQTPTLTILVEREREIRAFRPRTYWEIVGQFAARSGAYQARWFDPGFGKRDREGDEHRRAERIWDREEAERILGECREIPGTASDSSRPAREAPPRLFDLTTLQRSANSGFGYTAGRTLKLAQALYEGRKLITYPRTDSSHLPEDYLPTVRQTLEALGSASFGPLALKILDQGWAVPDKRIFDNAKVSDHFAIIPTPQAPPASLRPDERKLYEHIVRRFLAAFYPPAEHRRTVRTTRVGPHSFRSEGRVLIRPGWKEVYGKAALDGTELPPLDGKEETVAQKGMEISESSTRPRPRYTEAALLAAMEGAGKLVEDEELREAIKEKGLGTPATRAAIIENLIKEQYVNRDRKELVPTSKAFQLLTLLRGIQVKELCEPQLTGEWEQQLKLMEAGKLGRRKFMEGIEEMTRAMVERARAYDGDTVPGDYGRLQASCPKCGSAEVHETYRTYRCQSPGCAFSIRKILAGRLLEPAEAEELLEKRRVGPLRGFLSKRGMPFSAAIRLGEEFGAEFDFGREDPSPGGAEGEDLSGREPLGSCPRCQADVVEGSRSYLCRNGAGEERTCEFSVGKIILDRPVAPEQIRKILAEGRSDLLDGFVSRRTGRAFKAYLSMGKEGKVGFEFEPRQAGAAKGARKKPAPAPMPRVDFAGLEPLGPCPVCQGRIYETGHGYLCERSQEEDRPCRFREEKVRLGQPIEPGQIRKLLAKGRTDLLEGFVSAKTGKPFKAYRVLGRGGRIQYEFPPREDSSDGQDGGSVG